LQKHRTSLRIARLFFSRREAGEAKAGEEVVDGYVCQARWGCRFAALPANVERAAVATALACAVATLAVGMFAEAFERVRRTARTPLVTPRA
jgi:hypothetical protein